MKATRVIMLVGLGFSIIRTPRIWCADLSPDRFTTLYGFTCEKDMTLHAIQQKLGSAHLIEKGDAGEYEASICYNTEKSNVQFLSGEMGGTEHRLLGISIRKDKRPECSPLPTQYLSQSASLDGLKLGISRLEFQTIVGTTVTWKNDEGMASFETKRPMTDEELKRVRWVPGQQTYFDVDVSIAAEFTNEQLTSVRVWKVETY